MSRLLISTTLVRLITVFPHIRLADIIFFVSGADIIRNAGILQERDLYEEMRYF